MRFVATSHHSINLSPLLSSPLLLPTNNNTRSAILLDHLRGGTHVVMDRYAFSGVAFSSAKGVQGMTQAWCAAPDAGLPMPDVVFFMDIPVEKAAARAGFGGERYEDPAFQKRVRERFDAMRNEVLSSSHQQLHAPAAAGSSSSSSGSSTNSGVGAAGGAPTSSSWMDIDAAGTIEDIHRHLYAITTEVAKNAKDGPIRKLWSGEPL